MLDFLESPFCILKRGNLIGTNQSFNHLLECTAEELADRPLINLLATDDNEAIKAQLGSDDFSRCQLVFKTMKGNLKVMTSSPRWFSVEGSQCWLIEFWDMPAHFQHQIDADTIAIQAKADAEIENQNTLYRSHIRCADRRPHCSG